MKPQTQWNVLAGVVVVSFYLCGGGCIGFRLAGNQGLGPAQTVFGSALIAIPTFALGILLVTRFLGYRPAERAEQEHKHHEQHLHSMRRELSPLQRGDPPAVPATWVPMANLADALAHLGKHEAPFTHTRGYGEAIFTASMIFIGGLVLLVVALITLVQRGGNLLSALVLMGGLLVMVGSVVGLIFALRKKGADLRLLIYEKGLVRVDKDRFIVFLWDDILELYQVIVDVYQYGIIHTAQEYGFGLYRCDGEVLGINQGVNAADIGPLSDILQSKVAKHLWPQVIRQFKAGEDVVFGPITMNQRGVGNGSETIPWSEVEAITIAEGIVKIRKADKLFSWSKVEARDIPNLYVFLTLADKIIGVNR